MIVSARRVLLTPETFSSASLIVNAVRSTQDGLNVASGLGGSFAVEFVGINSDSGVLSFRAPPHADFPAHDYGFTPYEAARSVYATHPDAPFTEFRRMPIGAIHAVGLSARAIQHAVEKLAPASCTHVRLLSPVGDFEFPAADMTSGLPPGADLAAAIDRGRAETMRSHPSFAQSPLCFLTFLNEALLTARRNASPAPFTFGELAYELHYT